MNYFDEAAATWDDDPGKLRRTAAVAAAIAHDVPLRASWRALEFGGGTGALALALAGSVASIDLVDSSPGMVEVAKARFADRPGLRATVGDLGADPPRRGYDLVYASMALHHSADVPQTLRRFAELLVPGGWVAVADLIHDPSGSFHAHRHDFHGQHGFTDRGLLDDLAAAGFVAGAVRGCYTVTKPFEGEERDYPLNLWVARRASGPVD